jgi:hypothetical protein
VTQVAGVACGVPIVTFVLMNERAILKLSPSWFFIWPGLAVERVSGAGRFVHVLARTCATAAACTGCGVVSRRVHSFYRRRLADTKPGTRKCSLPCRRAGSSP